MGDYAPLEQRTFLEAGVRPICGDPGVVTIALRRSLENEEAVWFPTNIFPPICTARYLLVVSKAHTWMIGTRSDALCCRRGLCVGVWIAVRLRTR